MLDFSGVHDALIAVSISADGVDGFAEGFLDGGFAAIVDLSLAEEDFGLFGCASIEIKFSDIAHFRSERFLQGFKVAYDLERMHSDWLEMGSDRVKMLSCIPSPARSVLFIHIHHNVFWHSFTPDISKVSSFGG